MISIVSFHSKIWIFLALAFQMFFLIACRSSYDCNESAVLFSGWREGTENFNPAGTEKLESPDSTFAAEYAWEDPDTSDLSALFVIHKATGAKFLIGRSARVSD